MKNEMIICDQQSMYALGCAVSLKEASIIDQYYYVQSIDELKTLHTFHSIKCILIDSDMMHLDNTIEIERLLKIKEQIPIVILYNNEEDMVLFKIIEYGFSNIISRNAQKEELIKAYEMASEEKVYFSPMIADKIVKIINALDKVHLYEKVNSLPKEDKYILIRICDQASSKEIALELGFSRRTIEGHRTKLMQQFQVKNLAGLVKIAFETRLYQHYLSNPGLYIAV